MPGVVVCGVGEVWIGRRSVKREVELKGLLLRCVICIRQHVAHETAGRSANSEQGIPQPVLTVDGQDFCFGAACRQPKGKGGCPHEQAQAQHAAPRPGALLAPQPTGEHLQAPEREQPEDGGQQVVPDAHCNARHMPHAGLAWHGT